MTSGPTTSEQERATDNVVLLRLANGPLVGPVLCRVVSMMLARADWPIDRLDDALLVCDALCAHAPAHVSDRLTFSIRASEQEAELRVLELSDDAVTALLRDAMLPVVGNLFERVADRISVDSDEDGLGCQLVISLSPG